MKLKLQMDKRARVVALTNLEAMCERISGTCHTFKIVGVTSNRVRVEYSNPDEYGNPEPIRAEFPCYPIGFGDDDNRSVVLDAVRYTGCTGKNEEAWQAFMQLYDCPELFRTNPDANDWRSRPEIKAANPELLGAR